MRRLVRGGSCVVVTAVVAALCPSGPGGVSVAAVPSGTISTISGSDAPGPVRADRVSVTPMWVAARGGSAYTADEVTPLVRKVSSLGRETVVAGTGFDGAAANGVPARDTTLSGFDRPLPLGATFDSAGDMIFPEIQRSWVRILAGSTGTRFGIAMTAGDIYTLAGTGIHGFYGDGGSARKAELWQPAGVALDAAGNVLITDRGNGRVRVVAAHAGTYYGLSMQAAHIYTIAGSGSTTATGDGGPAKQAGVSSPISAAVDGHGDVLVSDESGIRVVAAVTHRRYGLAMVRGDIYTIVNASATDPVGSIAVDSMGNLVFDELGVIQVRARTSGTYYGVAMSRGGVYPVAGGGPGFVYSGDGSSANGATFRPATFVIDEHGNFIVADPSNHLILVVAWSPGTFYGASMLAGHVYSIAGNMAVASYTSSGVNVLNAELGGPIGLARDAAGNLLFADINDARVRVVANQTGMFYGVQMSSGHVYDVAGNGGLQPVADGGPALGGGLSARSVSVDPDGNLIVCDDTAVWALPATAGTFYGVPMQPGNVYRVAGGGSGFADGSAAANVFIGAQDAITDAAGNLLIAGSTQVYLVAAATGTAYGRHVTAGDIYAIAGTGVSGFAGDGGPATAAELASPTGLALDQAGNVIVADSWNNRLRLVAESTGSYYGQAMSAGSIYTIAGNGNNLSTGDGGPPTAAAIMPTSVTVDTQGNVLVAASGQVRMIAAANGNVYGVTTTAGDIYSIAGSSFYGCNFSGDGGPAVDASLCGVGSFAFDDAGDLLFSEVGASRIREIAA